MKFFIKEKTLSLKKIKFYSFPWILYFHQKIKTKQVQRKPDVGDDLSVCVIKFLNVVSKFGGHKSCKSEDKISNCHLN